MSVDLYAVTQILYQLEQTNELDHLTMEGINIWPMVRWCIGARLVKQQNQAVHKPGPSSEDVLKSQLAHAAREIGSTKVPELLKQLNTAHFEKYQNERNNLPQSNSQILVVTRGAQNYFQIKEKWYSPILDPIVEKISLNHHVVKIETNPQSQVSKTLVHPAYEFSSFHFLIASLVNWTIRNKALPKFSDQSVTGLSQLRASLIGLAPEVSWETENFADTCFRMLRLAEFYRDLIQTLKIKAAFQSCFYHTDGFALSLACHQTGIPSVDIQHGEQGPYHPYYTHYSRVPKTGYEILPNHIWVWGTPYAKYIQHWDPLGTQCHKVIVGGHPWLQRIKQKSDDLIDNESNELLAQLKTAEKSILVSLQYPIPDPLPSLLIETLKEAPVSWIWVFRHHPLSPKAHRDDLESTLNRYGSTNYVIDDAKKMPLAILLNFIDHHVTQSSTVCHEAHASGVATTFINVIAKKAFASLLESEVASLELLPGDIIKSIQNPPDDAAIASSECHIQRVAETMEITIEKIINPD
jgi:hypothetical protein